MIGSLMSRMGMAEKLSVAQLQKAVQDGTLPAYVGVPLIQDKLKQEQMAKAATSGAQQQQPPIAQQVMQAAEQRGIDEAQSNLPEANMAGGGIVAFAGGGMYDDDETDDDEDTLEERALAAETQSLFSQAAGHLHDNAESDHGIGSLAAPTPKEAKEIAYSINPESKGGIGIKDILAAKAAENKLPPELLNKIAGIESGYKSTAANPNSSAKGLFQFTDSTWKGMGGKAGEQFDPEKNAELGAKYVRQNAEGLKNALGRNPSYGEVYASHFFGLKGAKDLLNMDPKTPMSQAVSAQVLKANPQLKDKTVGQVMASLNTKMGEGIVALAQGGAIKGYSGMDNISLVSPEIKNFFSDKADSVSDMFKNVGKIKEYQKGLISPTPKDIPGGIKINAAKEQQQDIDEASNFAAPKADTTPTPESKEDEDKGIAALAEKEPSIEKQYMDLIKGRQAESAKQRSIDNYMALLQAGLGMMGGTSPHAAVNIGQGASTGIAAKMAAEKNRIAEENATMKGYGSLYNIQQNAELRKTLAGQSQEAAQRKAIGTNLLNLEAKTRAGIQSSLDKSMNTMGMTDEQKQAKVNELTAKALNEDATYRNMFKAYNGFDFAAPATVNTRPDSTFFKNTYGVVPKQ
jgi:soluble lytic murein transglycosylase-like protein